MIPRTPLILPILATAALLAAFAAPQDLLAAQNINTISGGTIGTTAPAIALSYPRRMAFDGAGNLYIADTFHHRVRKVAAGTNVVTTVAGTNDIGSAGDNGPAAAAQLAFPVGLAFDANGHLFIAEQGLPRIRRVDASTGVITTVAGTGTAGNTGDGGPATAAMLGLPNSIAIDAAGNIYIADRTNNKVRKITVSTGIITTIAGTGTAGFATDSPVAAATAVINSPRGLTVRSNGDIFFAEFGNHRIRKIEASSGLLTTAAGCCQSGFAGDGGQATAAFLTTPSDVEFNAAGEMFITDQGNGRVRKVATNGVITTVAGNGVFTYAGDGGPASGASFFQPIDVAFDSSGNLHVVDNSNHRIRKVDTATQVITTVAGGYVGDGPVAGAALNLPNQLALDATGNLYIADTDHFRVRKLDLQGNIATIAGNGAFGFSGDGGPATSAQVSYVVGIAVGSNGDVVLADTDNHRIRLVTAATGVISTIAGNGVCGSSGDNGVVTSAQVCFPWGVTVGPNGDLYIADTSSHRIRKVNANTLVITTVAGTGTSSFSGDGGAATSAGLSFPRGIAFDAAGNMYISDASNARIRKVAVGTGIITTFSGNGTTSLTGDGGPATSAGMNAPTQLSMDAAGNLYVAEEGSSRIRKITPAGIISTVTGTGAQGFTGDGGPASAAIIWGPRGVVADSRGTVYLADRLNHRIRKVDAPALKGSDFNADGKPDLIWSNTANGNTYLWTMNGLVLASDAFIAGIDPVWKVQGVGDFNGDGKQDIVWRNTTTGNTYVWYLNGATFISDAFLFSLPPEWVIQGVADFNADGKPDFLMRNTVSGNAFAWYFSNNVAIGDQFLFNIAPEWKVEGVGDFSADGQPDLLFRNMGSGLAFAWNTQFSGGTLSLAASSPSIFSIDPVWEVVQVADWNVDGQNDLLFRNRNTGLVFVWYMTGTTLTTSDFIIQIDPVWEIVPRR